MNLPQGPSRLIVPLALASCFAWLTFILVGWKWFIALGMLLLYEGWTLLNKYSNDTISETIWALSKRPLIPFYLGASTCGLISYVIPLSLEGLWIAFIIGMLMGHWVFQSQRIYDTIHEENSPKP